MQNIILLLTRVSSSCCMCDYFNPPPPTPPPPHIFPWQMMGEICSRSCSESSLSMLPNWMNFNRNSMPIPRWRGVFLFHSNMIQYIPMSEINSLMRICWPSKTVNLEEPIGYPAQPGLIRPSVCPYVPADQVFSRKWHRPNRLGQL